MEAWFRILGRYDNKLVYIDGFAGPGEYKNYPKGSPIVALEVAMRARNDMGLNWKADSIHCAFMEIDRARFNNLQERIKAYNEQPNLIIYKYNNSFVDGLNKFRKELPAPFRGGTPLFVFIDPFGATGAPFSVVADILSSSRSEVLINLDADGISRNMYIDDSPAVIVQGGVWTSRAKIE